MKDIFISAEDFKEEERHLDALVNAIMLVLHNPKKYLPFPNVLPYDTAWDYDEIDELNYKKKSNQEYFDNIIQPWMDHIDQPYYGRFDGYVDDEFISIYIGEDDLYENNERVVYSGQSPIGMFFTQASLKNGRFGKTKYEASLRRKLLVENTKLVLAEDVFVAGTDSKFQGITDPYLLRVLKSNRKKSSMTSILSSIQEKQFDIVCLPRDSSFIVQGCAGSGKTAILFQRLSNIQYNNPGYIDNKVRIISPNPGFIEFVGPLAKQLKLTHLTPITMCDYYNELLKRYNLEPIDNIKDENLLDKMLLKELYSDNFLYSIANEGKKYIDQKIEGIDFAELKKLLKNKGLNFHLDNIYLIDKLTLFISNVVSFFEEYIRKYNLIKNDYEKYSSLLKDYCREQSIVFKETKKAISNLLVLIKNKVFSLVKSMNDYVSDNNLSNISKIWLSNSSTTAEIFNLYDSIAEIEKAKKELRQSETFELNNLKEKMNVLLKFDKEKWETETLPSLIKEKEDLENNLSGLTFFALIRKQMIKNRINEIDKTIIDQTSKVTTFENNKKMLSDKIEQLEVSLSENDEIESNLKIRSFRSQLDSICLIVKAIDFFNENFDFLDGSNTIIDSFKLLSDLNRSKPFNYKKIYKNVVLPLIHKAYEKYNYEVIATSDKLDGKNYQFIPYIKLTLASMFLTKPYVKDKMVCIDEGQEYSKNEYILIVDINSDKESKLILNVYGDVHQRNAAKGIDDWSIFVPDICSKMFNLFENYRNTSEIVNYTNTKLGLNDIAIGIDDGSKVDEINFYDALEVIKNGNICIIIKEKSDLYSKLVGSVEFNNKINGNIVLTPWLSKGQEFENVIVFDKEMDNTEKYISYTRAKSKLYICSEF